MPESIFDNLKSKMGKKKPVSQELEDSSDKTAKILSSISQDKKSASVSSPVSHEQEESTVGESFSNFSKQTRSEKPSEPDPIREPEPIAVQQNQEEQKSRGDSLEIVKELEEKARMAVPLENDSEKESEFSSKSPVQVGEEESVLPDLPEKKQVTHEQKEIDSQNTINKQYFGNKAPEEVDYYKPTQSEAELAKEIIDPRVVEIVEKKKEESKFLNTVVFVLILVGIAVLSAIWFYFFGG